MSLCFGSGTEVITHAAVVPCPLCFHYVAVVGARKPVSVSSAGDEASTYNRIACVLADHEEPPP